MHDHTPTVRACKDCGDVYVPTWGAESNRHRMYRCHACYNAYQTGLARERRAGRPPLRPGRKPKPVTPRTCERCGAPRDKGKKRYCASCAPLAELERKRGRPARNWTRPCPCGVTFTSTSARKYCSDECSARPPKPEPKPPQPRRLCLDCAAPIDNLRKRCQECARLRNINRITSLYWVAAENIEVRKATAWRHEIVAYLRERDGGNCGICGKPMLFDVKTGPNGHDGGATIDHIVPRSLGGSDGLENLQLAHWGCNRKKGNRVGVQQLRLVG